MKLAIVVCVLFVSIISVECRFANVATQTDIAFDAGLDYQWVEFKKTHNKRYKLEEEFSRRVIWEKNVRKVQQHNLEFDMGKHTFSMGINEYSDLTWDEYRKYLLGARPPKVRKYNSSGVYKRTLKDLPKTVDWRTKGYVTPIKNQGQCGSCWAFSTTGCLEGQHFKRTGQLVSLSEQNLVDCATGNAGCGGGWMDTAYYYVQTNGGIDTENSYPYEAKDDTCRYNPQSSGASDYGYLDVAKGDEEALQAATAEIGPIAVAIDATHESFQQYRSGVYYEPACSNTTTDHAVLAIGYGNYYGQDYWLVKNSWGTSWGMNGFIMMARNKNNHCAIATFASFPIV